jgi:hypothetical protein
MAATAEIGVLEVIAKRLCPSEALEKLEEIASVW